MSNPPLDIPPAVQSTSNGCTGSRPKGLPKTIEEATRRYLANYQANFVGPASEMARLRDIAEAKIYNLRKKQPKFFEEKLPHLVNQACSELLTCDTSTESGKKVFHYTHKHFLKVLDELWRSVPEGEVNFKAEKDRSVWREQLCQRQLELRTKIDQLESIELNLDDLGEEEDDNLYVQTYSELDKLKQELHTVSIQIAALEGENLEEEIEFQLKIPPRSLLKRLSQKQVQKLENMLLEFIKDNEQNNQLFMDIRIIDSMIARLDIDPNLFTKEEMRDMSRDALDAYRRYFRERDSERRNDLFDSLLRNKSLLPKEGLIFDGPDDVSEEVKEELDQIDRRYKRKIDDMCEEWSKRPCTDDIEEDVEDDSGGKQDTKEILEIVKKSNPIFAQVRVKEEPRDDYEYEVPSEDELEVSEEMADALAHQDVIECADENNLFSERDSSLRGDEGNTNGVNLNGNVDSTISSNNVDRNASTSNEVNGHGPSNGQTTSGLRKPADTELVSGLSQDDSDKSDVSDLRPEDNTDDEDIEFVGIVEPTDKIKHVDLDDGEDRRKP